MGETYVLMTGSQNKMMSCPFRVALLIFNNKENLKLKAMNVTYVIVDGVLTIRDYVINANG